MRTICWCAARTRVFLLVLRSGSWKSPASVTPFSSRARRSSSPFSSLPITEQTATLQPSAIRLFTTFPAPPRRRSSRDTSTTCTGASGEMRSALPQRYSSSIRSPMTSARTSPARSNSDSISRLSIASPIWRRNWANDDSPLRICCGRSAPSVPGEEPSLMGFLVCTAW